MRAIAEHERQVPSHAPIEGTVVAVALLTPVEARQRVANESARFRLKRTASTERRAITAAIFRLLRLRGTGKSICPSEVARLVAADAGSREWRMLMPSVRLTAAALARRKRVVIMQRGSVIDADHARGPIRIALTNRV